MQIQLCGPGMEAHQISDGVANTACWPENIYTLSTQFSCRRKINCHDCTLTCHCFYCNLLSMPTAKAEVSKARPVTARQHQHPALVPGTAGTVTVTHQTTTRTANVIGDNSRSADARGDDVSITQTSTRVNTRINGNFLG